MRRLRTSLALVFGTLTLGGAAAWIILRPWWRRWDVDRPDAARRQPAATSSRTRR